MVPHRSNKAAARAMAVSTSLLAGALLAGCGQQPADPDGMADAAGKAMDQSSSSGITSPTDDGTHAEGTSSADSADPASDRTASGSAAEPEATPGNGNAAAGGSGDTSTSGSGGKSGSTGKSGSSGPERCHTSMLAASLAQGHPGAGQRYAELTLRNTSGTTCTVYGYPGLEFAGDGGSALPTDVQWTAAPGPSTVRLAPDESTTTTLHWGVVSTGTGPAGGDCEPTPSALRVTPPDETDVLRLQWDYGRVCGNGHVSATAFH